MCVMLVGSEEKATNLAGFLVWRAWHFGSQLHRMQGLLDISERQTQKFETDKNQSAEVMPGTQRENAGDIYV